jgi:DNA-binding CsgD family transcriptional regulator
MKIRYVVIFLTLLQAHFLGFDALSYEVDLFDHAEFYVDSTGSRTIDELAGNRGDVFFSEPTDAIKNQSFTNFRYWLKIDPDVLNGSSLFVISKNVFIDEMKVYVGSGSEWKVTQAGMLILNDSKFDHSSISIKIPKVKEGEEVYVSFQSDCISKLDGWLLDELTLTKSESFKLIFYAFILTFIVIYLLVVVFLYFTTKNKGLLYFIFYALASIGMILFTNGYLYQYGPKSALFFYKWSFVYFVDLYWGAAVLLSYYLLKVDQLSIRLKRTYHVALGLLGLMMLSPLFMSRQLVAQIHFLIPVLFIFFNVLMGFIIFIRYKNKTALLLSLGWLVYFAFLSIWSISKTGIIETSFFVDNCPVFGLTFEFVLFAVIAARSYLIQHKERLIMQERIKNIDSLKSEVEKEYGEIYASLSAREQEVLKLIAEGKLDKEISDQLGITVASVRTYSKRIYTKLNVANRTEASLIYNKVILTKFI